MIIYLFSGGYLSLVGIMQRPDVFKVHSYVDI